MSEKQLTIEELAEKHPDLLAKIEARAREGFFSKAALDAAVSVAKEGMIATAEHEQDVAKARTGATAIERDRVMAVYLSCKGCNTMPMFEGLVQDGCTEQQANHRIQDALAVASDALEITTHHSGGAYSRQRMSSGADIYANRAQQGGKP